MWNKQKMYEAGVELLKKFCTENKLEVPTIIRMAHPGLYFTALHTCGFYRHARELTEINRGEEYLKKLTGTDDKWGQNGNIFIAIDKCAKVGYGGRAWSFPGYTVDRTPYGVLQHELGHYVDEHMSKISGTYFSMDVLNEAREPQLTGYLGTGNGKHPGEYASEWFAENFRLFVTNSDLCRHLRPNFFALMEEYGFVPVETRKWQEVLADAPDRTIEQVHKKIASSVK